MTNRKQNDEVMAFHMPKNFETLSELYDCALYYDEDLHEHIITGDVIEFEDKSEVVSYMSDRLEFIGPCSEDFVDKINSAQNNHTTTHKGVTKIVPISQELYDYMAKNATPFEKKLYAFIAVTAGQKIVTKVTDCDGNHKVRVKMFAHPLIETSAYRPILESKEIDVIMIGKKSFKNASDSGKKSDKKITF